MPRIVIIGNSGGGKSTLARTLAKRRGLRHVEVDQHAALREQKVVCCGKMVGN
jgi:adenylate kinase family enzyme